jgi:hypothetical protein
MSHPADAPTMEELNERVKANSRTTGTGLDTMLIPACPFCGAPQSAQAGRSVAASMITPMPLPPCPACSRRAQQQITRNGESQVLVSLVCVEGPPLPEYLQGIFPYEPGT